MTCRSVHLIDDDPAMRRALERVLKGRGFQVKTYAGARAFLDQDLNALSGCLILDVAMPGMTGTELHRRLKQVGFQFPIILLTAHGDIPLAVDAIKEGAFHFLSKPVESDELVKWVTAALERADRVRERRSQVRALEERFMSLTPREREVFLEVIKGLPNKVIAAGIGTSEQTVKVHRMRLTAKLGVYSSVDLLGVAQVLGLDAGPGFPIRGSNAGS